MKSEIISAKVRIGEHNNKLREKESIFKEKNLLIQVKYDQLFQIMKVNERNENTLKSDLFMGIFYGLTMIFGRNLADSGDIDETESSNSSNCPKNVLNNDSCIWHSQNLPYSGIQFGFKQRKVSITSCSINDRNRVESWKVERSTFGIIDNKVVNTDFQNGNLYYINQLIFKK